MGATTAVKIAELSSWSLSVDAATADSTAMEQDWDTVLKGTNKWSGSISGFYDDTSDALFDAAISGDIQKCYLYPQAAAPTKYFYGTAYPKFSIEVGLTDAVKISGDLEGSDALAKN